MEQLAEIIAIVADLPSYARTIVAFMVVVQAMATAALGTLRVFREEGLPWGASSGRLRAAMLWLVFLPPAVVALLFLYHIGVGFGKEAADAFQQLAR